LNSRLITAAFAACVITAASAAQIMTLSQSTSSVPSAANSAACGPAGLVYTVDNGYFRSYPLAALPSAIQVVSITFGVENILAPASGFPMVIRIFNDPTPGVIAPYAGLTLLHTESFTLPTTATATVFTQVLSGPPVVMLPSDTLVVELFSQDGAYTGSRFVMGSNGLGQTAPSFIRAPGCTGLAEPTDTAAIGFPNMHIVLDVNYAFVLPSPYVGTGEDLFLLTGINANPLTSGFANEVKTALAGDTVTMRVLSPQGTFNFRELVVIFQIFATGNPPFPPLAIGIPFTAPGFLLGGAPPPLGPALLAPGGTTISVLVPPGLTGTSALLQGVVITWTPPTAANGLYASTSAHEIQFQ
jgi:hypothetical protein